MAAVRGDINELTLKEILSETFTFEVIDRKIGVVRGCSAPVPGGAHGGPVPR